VLIGHLLSGSTYRRAFDSADNITWGTIHSAHRGDAPLDGGSSSSWCAESELNVSNLSQERPQSRFRLAKLETPGAKLPPIAKQLEVCVDLGLTPVRFGPIEPQWITVHGAVELPELTNVDLPVGGFSEEELAQAKEYSENLKPEDPPAGIAAPFALAVEVRPLAPPKSNPLADCAALPLAPSAVANLAADLTTLHSRYMRGPKPVVKAAEPEKPKLAETKPAETKPPEAPKAATPQKAPEPAKPAAPGQPPQPAKPGETAKSAAAQSEPVPAKKEPPKPEPSKEAEPAAKRPEPSAKPAEPSAKPEPSPKPKISIRPPEPAKSVRPDVRRPTTMVARGSAQPVAQDIPETPAPAPAAPPEPKVIPIRKPDPVAASPVREPEPPMLGLSTAEPGGSGMGLKIGIAAGVLAVLGGVGFFMMRGSPAKPAETTSAAATEAAEALPTLGGAGWTTNWGTEAPTNKGKQIALYRPTMAISDYRIEIQGQIEKKALGWIFRAHDPKNYYVMKIEWLKPGVEDPIPALIKYAIIDGKETTRTQVMLPLDNVTLTSMFKIRTDVKGDKFTTYVNDKRVDYWSDDQIAVGGAGLYAEANERAIIKSTSISGLR